MTYDQSEWFNEGAEAFRDGEQMCHNPYLDEDGQESSDAAIWWANGHHAASEEAQCNQEFEDDE